MSDEIKINRPAQPRQDYNQAPMAQDEQAMPSRGGSKMPWIVLGVIVLLLIIAGVIFRKQLFGGKMTGDTASQNGAAAVGSPSGYEAIFLTNGQVYFGKLTNPDGDYVTLDDIYYLQVGPQQGSATTAGQAPATPQQQISLVKLGNELHGPVDEMHISRSQVLFYEDLKTDGQVVKAIMQDKASKAATPSK